MEDQQIITLFWQRKECAIAETQQKYGRYCHYIAQNVLKNEADAAEICNDAWLRAWNAIPPEKPGNLRAFLGKITRNLALNRLEKDSAQKRGRGEMPLIFDEIGQFLPVTDGVLDRIHLKQVLDDFLAGLRPEQRKIFVRRYWYMSSVREIATDYGITESKVTVTLCRLRQKLAQKLQEEEIFE